MTRTYSPGTEPSWRRWLRLGWRRPAAQGLLGWLAGSLFCLAAAATPAATGALDAWIQDAGLPPEVGSAFIARTGTDPGAGNWVVARDGLVYSLAFLALARDKPAQIRRAKSTLVEMRSRQGLFFYAAGEYFERQGFTQREAIARALATLESRTEGRLLAGLQSRTGLLDEGVVALSWIPEEWILAYRQQPPPLDRFLMAYCEAIYPAALALHQQGRHAEALALYKEMHARQCRQPLAYFLDAADSFLALQQPGDAQRMTAYLLSEFGPALDSAQSERAGDILLKAGDEDKARQAYQQALDLITGRDPR